jgi:hypothetical protein
MHCVNTELALNGSPDQGEPEPATFVWKQIAPFNQTIDSSASASVMTIPLLDKENYIFSRLVYKGECEDTSLTDTVYINPRPVASILNPVQDEACEYDTTLATPNDKNRYFIRIAFDPDEGAKPFRVQLSEQDSPLAEKTLTSYTDSILVDPTTDNFDTYNYKLFSVVDANGCEAYPSGMTGTLDLTVYATPEANILTESQLCPPLSNQTIQLIADSDNGTDLIWRQLSGPEQLEIADSTSESASVDIPGLDERAVYGFEFLSKKGSIKVCEGRAEIEITIYEEPRMADEGGLVDAGEDQEQFWNDIGVLNGSTNAGSGIWSTPTEGVTIDDSASAYTYARNLLLYKPPDDKINEFIWTVRNGVCIPVIDSLFIIRKDVKRYDGFSPNGDGVNDYFIMQGLVGSEGENPSRIIFTLNIYNSVGNLVRQVTQNDEIPMETNPVDPLSEDERVVWDGLSNNGSIVPPGIYYYGLEYYTILLDQEKNEIGRVTGTPKRGSIVVKGY